MRLTGEEATWRLRRSGQWIGRNASMWHHRDQGRTRGGLLWSTASNSPKMSLKEEDRKVRSLFGNIVVTVDLFSVE